LKIAFYTEAGKKRGYGHLVRSYTIYEYCKKKGFDSTFFLDSDINFSDKYSDIHKFSWSNFNINKAYDIIFIDSYDADIRIYEYIESICKVPIYIDDYRRLEYPRGVILNFAPDADSIFYKEKADRHTYLLGLDYIPIRNVFMETKVKKEKQIFIMLGGTDTGNIISANILSNIKDIHIKKVVVINQANTRLKLEKLENTKVLYKPTDKELSYEMAKSFMAISTASMCIYELAYLNIPTIIIAISENQKIGSSQFLKHKLALKLIDIQSGDYSKEINECIKNLKKNSDIKIDGNGNKRILDSIIKLASK